MPTKPKSFSARGMTTTQVLALQNRLNHKIVQQFARNFHPDQKLEKIQRALRHQVVQIGMTGLDMLENMTLPNDWKASYTLQHRGVHCKALNKVLMKLRGDEISEFKVKFEVVHYERNLFRTSRSLSQYQEAFVEIEKNTARTQWEYREAKTNKWIPFPPDRNDAIEAHYLQAAKRTDYCFADEHGTPHKLTLKGDSLAIQSDATVVSMRESYLINKQTEEKQLVRCHHVALR